jgi:hypothetical protein
MSRLRRARHVVQGRSLGDGSGLSLRLSGDATWPVVELAAYQAALSAGGDGAAVVISGPPGIGKTSLWRALAGSRPAGVVVLRATGVPGGRAAFANLADLLDPVADTVLAWLPEPQADALRAALGLSFAKTPVPVHR